MFALSLSKDLHFFRFLNFIMSSHRERVQRAYQQRRRDLLRQVNRGLLIAPIPRQRISDRMNPLEALRSKDFR